MKGVAQIQNLFRLNAKVIVLKRHVFKNVSVQIQSLGNS